MAKRLLQSIAKKLWQMLTCITNHWLTKNEAIPNIDEYNKMNTIFSRICLVPRASNVLFDDGEVHCRVYDLWLSWTYWQTIIWKWTGPLKYCNINILTLIQARNKLKLRSHCYVHLILQKQDNWQKNWRIVVIHQIHQRFSPSKFLLYGRY